MLWGYFERLPVGHAPFAGLSGSSANGVLKECCVTLELAMTSSFRCHDFRRGHAKDLQLSGATLWQILAAGEWSSPAFLSYLDTHRLETDAVVQAHVNESGGEDD